MKKVIGLFLLVVMIVFSGCSNRKVEEVKNGVLKFDKSLTVGEAFDNYKYCKNVKWESFKTDNGREIVQVTCDYDVFNKDNSEYYRKLFKQEGLKKLEITYQFDILKTGNKFELRGEYLKSIDKNGKVLYKNDKSSATDAFPDLKHIYENEPLL